jgi:hypothetical protein
MLNHLLLIVILYLVINQMILSFSDDKRIEISNNKKEVLKEFSNPNYSQVEKVVPLNLFGKPFQVEPGKFIIWSFVQPKPWTQIIYNYGQEFPFRFFIKIKIPTLNDYQIWKQIIPNMDFDSKTGEIIIPSKDDAGALAITNLIVSNFQGQLSIENILEKNLIPISITKAQQFEMVRNKLKEQIIESIQSKSIEQKSDFEQDLAKIDLNINLKESFHNLDPSAYEGGEFTYL